MNYVFILLLIIGVHSECSYSCNVCDTETGTCLQCITDYVLGADGVCKSCDSLIPNCKSCNTANYCLACDTDEYYFNGTACTECSNKAGNEKCDYCKKDGTCSKCSYGYYLDAGNICKPCGLNCYNCEDYTGRCTYGGYSSAVSSYYDKGYQLLLLHLHHQFDSDLFISI